MQPNVKIRVEIMGGHRSSFLCSNIQQHPCEMHTFDEINVGFAVVTCKHTRAIDPRLGMMLVRKKPSDMNDDLYTDPL